MCSGTQLHVLFIYLLTTMVAYRYSHSPLNASEVHCKNKENQTWRLLLGTKYALKTLQSLFFIPFGWGWISLKLFVTILDCLLYIQVGTTAKDFSALGSGQKQPEFISCLWYSLRRPLEPNECHIWNLNALLHILTHFHGLPAGFLEDLKMVVLAWRQRWRFVPTRAGRFWENWPR